MYIANKYSSKRIEYDGLNYDYENVYIFSFFMLIAACHNVFYVYSASFKTKFALSTKIQHLFNFI
jgi:hypothetical protein